MRYVVFCSCSCWFGWGWVEMRWEGWIDGMGWGIVLMNRDRIVCAAVSWESAILGSKGAGRAS